MERLRRLIHEIHRRSLWQVLGIYVVASRGVLSIVDTAGSAEEAIEQYRETIQLNPEWPNSWAFLSQLLLQLGQYDEGLEAHVMVGRLSGVEDPKAWREWYQAAVRHRETGVPQRWISCAGQLPFHVLRAMPDPITRLSAALEGRYRIERELGERGMATAYVAE